jgi:CHAT domain-containing protein
VPPSAPATTPLFGGGAIGRTALSGLAPLPYAERELRGIGALIGSSSTILTGAAATELAVAHAAADRFDVIAIATHALGGGSFAGLNEPALVLTPGGGGDGLLTASEVAGMRLDADWVILSGCDTASGLGDGSPAYSGLASAFMQAGARALLVSHWPVRDDAAEALTVATVRNAQNGLSRSRALQRAMLSAMANKRLPYAAHPAYWAPFVLVQR